MRHPSPRFLQSTLDIVTIGYSETLDTVNSTRCTDLFFCTFRCFHRIQWSVNRVISGYSKTARELFSFFMQSSGCDGRGRKRAFSPVAFTPAKTRNYSKYWYTVFFNFRKNKHRIVWGGLSTVPDKLCDEWEMEGTLGTNRMMIVNGDNKTRRGVKKDHFFIFRKISFVLFPSSLLVHPCSHLLNLLPPP